MCIPVYISAKLVLAAGIQLLNCGNINPEKLTILSLLIKPLAAVLPNIISLAYLKITGYVSDSDLPVLIDIVQSHPTLEVLEFNTIMDSSAEQAQLVMSASKLKKLTISGHDITELLPCNIKNVKKLTITSTFFRPLTALALFPIATSLTYLEITGYVLESHLSALTNIVQSHPTLEVLNVDIWLVFDSAKLSPLVETAGNSRLKKLTINQCDIIEILNYKNTNPKKLVISCIFPHSTTSSSAS